MTQSGPPLLCLLVSVLAACGFALSAPLQHATATEAGSASLPALRLLRHLVGRPWWILGQLLAFVSFALHALALHLGPLTLVQPVVVSGVVLAVPVRAMLARRLPVRRELATVALIATGLALVVITARPSSDNLPGSSWRAAVFGAAVLVVAGVLVARAGRCRDRAAAARLFGLVAGLLFGLVAGLLKLSLSLTTTAHDPLTLLTTWSTWAVVGLGLAGVATTQYGYRSDCMASSVCVLNLADVGVALLFGVVVFGEVPAHSPAAVATGLLGVLLIVQGLRRLARDRPHAAGPGPGRTAVLSTPSSHS